jgi:hypothetical protein
VSDGVGGSGLDDVCWLFLGLITEELGELVSGDCCLDRMGSGRISVSVLFGLVISAIDEGSPHREGGALLLVCSVVSVWCDSVWFDCRSGADAVEASSFRLTV